MDTSINVGKIISDLRKQRGWSQTDLAKASEVSREIIGKYERGGAVPSIEFAKRIADAFDVSLDYLVGEGQNAKFDKKIMKRIEELQNMKADFREHIFAMLDSVIRDYKTQQSYKSL